MPEIHVSLADHTDIMLAIRTLDVILRSIFVEEFRADGRNGRDGAHSHSLQGTQQHRRG